MQLVLLCLICIAFLDSTPLYRDIIHLFKDISRNSTYFEDFFKASALWGDAFYKSKCPSVCVFVRVFVCVFTFEVPFKRLFAPTSQSRMSDILRDLESLGKSNGKKWFQIRTFLFKNCQKLPHKKKFFFLLILPYKTWWKPRFPVD